MLPFPKLLLVMLGLNLIGSFVFYFASVHHDPSLTDLRLSSTQDLFTQTDQIIQPEPPKYQNLKPGDFSIPISEEKISEVYGPYKMDSLADRYSPEQTFSRLTNPFFKLGGYPEVKIALPYEHGFEQLVAQGNYGIQNEDDYCERVDYYNLANPENIFEKMNFFSDFADDSVVRRDVIRKIGEDTKPEISKYTPVSVESQFTLDPTINTFYMDTNDFHSYHQIGKNFLCATQMYNQIPGSRALVRKNDLLESFDRWITRHAARSYCFNDTTYFLDTYRLSNQQECDSFFNKIKNKRYQRSLGSEPIQFIIKSGHEAAGDGIYLLDKETTEWLMNEFRAGTKCGSVDTDLIAEKYITNPLLLNNQNKFDFRVYMLIASTNPLIVYSHDGYLRASLAPYDKFSSEPEKHLTSSHVAYDSFMAAKEHGTYHGKTEQELRDSHILAFEDLQKYLLETGKITDEKWLETSLRPQIKKVMIHLVKMTSSFYLKQSNVFGLFGLDFMLDDELNLWFIEADANPQMTAVNKLHGEILNKMLTSMFEIEYGLYRSRMKRVFDTIRALKSDQEAGYATNYENWKAEYLEDVKNKFEPEFRMSKENSFSLVMDESLPGPDAYRGYLDIMCVFAH